MVVRKYCTSAKSTDRFNEKNTSSGSLELAVRQNKPFFVIPGRYQKAMRIQRTRRQFKQHLRNVSTKRHPQKPHGGYTIQTCKKLDS